MLRKQDIDPHFQYAAEKCSDDDAPVQLGKASTLTRGDPPGVLLEGGATFLFIYYIE